MFPYWLLLLMLSAASLFYQRRAHPAAVEWPVVGSHRIRSDPALILALVAITLMIGFRYRVGGDWKIYQLHFGWLSQWPLSVGLHRAYEEPGYTFVNWLVGQVGGGLWLVNLVCAVPFVVGLATLCRQQPNPWLALVVATPLIIIVIGMGYTRQATALGFLLIGLTGLIAGRSYWWFLAWTLLASLFHQSVLVLIPIVALFLIRVSVVSVLLLVGAAIVSYYVLLPHALERYSHGYINQVYQAKGAIFRIAPNAATALLPLIFRKQFATSGTETRILRGWSYLAVAVFAAFFAIRSTVILDRLSVYIAPLQVWVWSRLPTAFGEKGRPHLFLTALVIAYSAIVLGLWLAFANHARYWLPYQVYPLL